MEKETQWAKILDYCEKHGSITIREAFALGINSPSKRISELKESPWYVVTTVKEVVYDSDGKQKNWFKRYFIREVLHD
jgi:hypothetical protein